MALPTAYRTIAQPFRWATAGAVVLGVLGAAYGSVEAIRDYPVSSWFGVVLYVAMLGVLVGGVVGLTAGVVGRRSDRSGPG